MVAAFLHNIFCDFLFFILFLGTRGYVRDAKMRLCGIDEGFKVKAFPIFSYRATTAVAMALKEL